ncbi:hypothetical protein KIW84_055680, partial [Lathyrus oleraceus]
AVLFEGAISIQQESVCRFDDDLWDRSYSDTTISHADISTCCRRGEVAHNRALCFLHKYIRIQYSVVVMGSICSSRFLCFRRSRATNYKFLIYICYYSLSYIFISVFVSILCGTDNQHCIETSWTE